MAKFCSNCGKEVDENATFCASCGTNLQTGTNANVTSNGQPFVNFNVNRTNNELAEKQAKSKKKVGAMVASIICFVIGLIFTSVYVYQYIGVLSADGSALSFVFFILFAFTIGLISIIPAFILMVASLITSSFCFKSTSKGVKVVGIILFILSLIIIVAFVMSFIIPSMLLVG